MNPPPNSVLLCAQPTSEAWRLMNVARSSDGGATFINRQASDVGWAHKSTEFGGGFIGDYIDCKSSEHGVYPMWCDGRTRSQDVYTDEQHLDLYTDTDTLSAATGGQVKFTLNIGPNKGGAGYFLLGSITGTSTGITFPNGTHVPIDFDLFTVFAIRFANTPSFADFFGTLDSTGSAAPTLDSLGTFDPAFAGVTLYFAALIDDGAPCYGTNPTKVELVP